MWSGARLTSKAKKEGKRSRKEKARRTFTLGASAGSYPSGRGESLMNVDWVRATSPQPVRLLFPQTSQTCHAECGRATTRMSSCGTERARRNLTDYTFRGEETFVRFWKVQKFELSNSWIPGSHVQQAAWSRVIKEKKRAVCRSSQVQGVSGRRQVPCWWHQKTFPTLWEMHAAGGKSGWQAWGRLSLPQSRRLIR